jgi:hypothetical protein
MRTPPCVSYCGVHLATNFVTERSTTNQVQSFIGLPVRNIYMSLGKMAWLR